MVALVPYNPYITTNAPGTFNIRSEGFIQGMALDDPSSRHRLAGGILAQSEVIPMWGGVAISEAIPGVAKGPSRSLGGVITRATSVAQMTGFSVFDQNHSALQTSQSAVPLVGSGMTMHFYRFGSNARIPVAMDPALLALDGSLVNTPVSWDFAQQRLVPFAPVEGNETISGITWANGIATVTTGAPHGYVAGDDVTISGTAPAGYSGTVTIAAVPSATTFTYALPVNPGPETTPGQINAGGGALPVRVLAAEAGNCMTVAYSPTTGFATWNYSGSCAVILL